VIPAGACCGLHVEAAAVDLCKRCGRFLCGECVQLVDEYAYCAECVGKLDGPPSRLANAALYLGLIALLLMAAGFVFGPALLLAAAWSVAALVTSGIEILRIKRNTSSVRGFLHAFGGLVAGVIVSLVTFYFIMVFLASRGTSR
jgi:hypothetical protein